MHVLVVDDDHIFCALAKRKLPDTVSHTVEAYDGLTAWQLAQAQSFDLALIDLGLPGLDGLSLIARLRNNPKTEHVPIIVITGRDDREAIDAAFGAGATFFLTKPINWSLFGHHVSCVMRLSTSEREARQARQRAQAESRIKDTVIGRLNHSFRPLAREMGICAAEIAKLATQRVPAAVVAPLAAAMVADARRLEEGLDNMVVFAKAVSDHLDLREKRISIGSVLDGPLRDAQEQARVRGLDLKVELPTDDIDLVGDPEQLARAIFNLIENALRFAPAGSVVKLAAQQPNDGSVYISVDDEGPGIAPEMLAQLLAPLVDVDNGGRGVPYLSGLGLAVSKLIAEGHGGSLMVRSAPGRGTTASIHLPPDRVLDRDSDAA